jgi:hypothetical protein
MDLKEIGFENVNWNEETLNWICWCLWYLWHWIFWIN